MRQEKGGLVETERIEMIETKGGCIFQYQKIRQSLEHPHHHFGHLSRCPSLVVETVR